MKHLAVASVLLLASVPAAAAMDMTPGQQMDAASNFCKSQNPDTVVGIMRAHSCFADIMATVAPQWDAKSGVRGTEAIYARYAREMDFDFIVDKYIALIRHSPTEEWDMILDLFYAETNRAMAELRDALLQHTRKSQERP